MYKNENPEYITVGLFFLGFVHPLFFGLLALYIAGAIWIGSSTYEYPVDNSRDIDPQLANFLYMKRQYLLSSNWRDKREQALQRDRYMCRNCNSTTRLNVHHIRYSSIPNEPLTHLITLCESCHTQGHQFHGYPQTYSDYMRWNNSLKDTHANHT